MAEYTREYQPQTLDEVVGQDDIVATLKVWADEEVENVPFLMFIGPQGVGKSSTALAFCNDGKFQCEHLNPSMFGGKDDVGELTKTYLLHGGWAALNDNEGRRKNLA